jgi:acetyl esterase/lipase
MYLSPLNATDDMWEVFPKTFIFVGTQDPLYCESKTLREKLERACVAVKLVEYPVIYRDL